ncbi:MAG: ABC transporter ATP-binding protein [Pseudorhodoplanes sp.]|jgi:ATP-binding cassette subfamily C protein|nr:ABC transporter ATP-binding protein [Pseudorhodoplanes sp.]
MSADSANNQGPTVRRDNLAAVFIEFLRDDPLRLLLALAVVLIAGIFEGIGILTLLPIIVIAIGGEHSSGGIAQTVSSALAAIGIPAHFGVLLSITVVAVVATAVLRLVSTLIAGNASVEVAAQMRLSLVRAFMQARWSYFIRQSTGRLTNAVTNEANQAASLYSSLISLVATVLQVLIYVTIALFTSWQVTVAGLLVGLLMVASLHALVHVTRLAGRRQVMAMADLMSRVVEGLQLIKPLKAMAREDRLAPLLESDTQELKTAQRNLLLATTLMSIAQEPIFAIFLAIGLYCAVRWLNYPIAELLFMVVVFQRLVSRIGTVQILYQKAASFESSYRVARDILVEARSEQDQVLHGRVVPRLERSIALRHVNFSYDAVPVLCDVSMVIPAGQMTALIGPSGAGKSTLIDILLGMSIPNSGEVEIDGTPLSQIDISKWRRLIGYVPQDVVLWHDTIANNVSLRDPAIAEQEIEAALRGADALAFVTELPDGMRTMVGERGARLSGGQRQRISIARALVRNPRFLVLDEPTTALDPDAEKAICGTLRNLAKDITVLAISHQPAIIGAADRVYDLSQGSIVLRGSEQTVAAAI